MKATAIVFVLAPLCALLLRLPAKAAPPVYDHVVIVIEENEDYGDIIGSPDAPYINSLAAGGVSLTRMRGITHPSQPNYLEFFSGDNQGITSDTSPVTGSFSTPNLATGVLASGRTFVGYADALPLTGDTVSDNVNGYRRYHCPWIWWASAVQPTPANKFPASLHKPFTTFPSDFTKLPTVAIVIPSNYHNMHDYGVASGDLWLANNLSAYAEWAPAHNSLLIVTWDESYFLGGTGQSNSTATILYGANLMTGQSAGSWTLHNLLRTIEDMYGLPHSGRAALVPPITGAFAGDLPVTTRSFVNGTNGYAGQHDAMVKAAKPSTVFGTISPLIAVGNGSQSTIQSLIRFDNLFGPLSSQVPAASVIVSAKLFLTTSNDATGPSVAPMNIHRMLAPWNENSTWNSLAGGVSLDGAEAAATAEFSAVPSYNLTVASFDVTASVKAWQSGAANNGWTIQTTNTNDWYWLSAESSQYRPVLEVSYVSGNSVGLTANVAAVNEDGGSASLVVARNGSDALSVDYATSNLTAEAGSDYTATSGTLTWGAGDTSTRTITIPITFNTAVEGNETLRVTLSNATGQTQVGNYGSAVVTIAEPAMDNWRLTHFGIAGANSPDAADAADPEADGLPNLAEYALLFSPITRSQPPSATVSNYLEGQRLRMLVPRDPARNDITMSVEAASDLNGPWTTLATSTLGAPFTGPGYWGGDSAAPGVKIVHVRDGVNITDVPQRFMRVKVTH
jgi:hypothetical protein